MGHLGWRSTFGPPGVDTTFGPLGWILLSVHLGWRTISRTNCGPLRELLGIPLGEPLGEPLRLDVPLRWGNHLG